MRANNADGNACPPHFALAFDPPHLGKPLMLGGLPTVQLEQ
jgi:hypothetical protein